MYEGRGPLSRDPLVWEPRLYLSMETSNRRWYGSNTHDERFRVAVKRSKSDIQTILAAHTPAWYHGRVYAREREIDFCVPRIEAIVNVQSGRGRNKDRHCRREGV